MAVNPYGRTSKRGVVLNWRTVEMLEITELRELRDLTPLRLSQGSYTTDVGQSAGTHAGGGALDVRLRDVSSTQWNSIVAALRRSYYGPERWDSRDFNRLFAKWLDVSAGSLTRPDTGDVINPDVAQCLRAAYWVRTRLTDSGLDDVARQLFTADNIIRNVGVDPEVDPQAA